MSISAEEVLADAFRNYQAGRLEEAVALCRKAIELRPDLPDAHNNMGVTLQKLGRLDEAVACFRRVLALKPDDATAHNTLGNVLTEQKQLDEAVTCYRRAIELRPDYAHAHNNLGVVLREHGRLDEAVASCRRAIELKPDYSEAHTNLGNALIDQRRADEAVTSFQRAIELTPDLSEAHSNLGVTLQEQGQLDEAIAACRRAIDLNPDSQEAHSNLGIVLQRQGRLDEALASFARAAEIEPKFLVARSNLLFAMNYLGNQPPEAMRSLARQFGTLISGQIGHPFTSWLESPPDRPLRVGLVSGDLNSHPVGYFLEGMLRAIDPDRVELLAFPSSYREDDLTARIRPAFKAWTPIGALSDEAAARLIHAQGVQVLLDLSGHTEHNRLPVFGWRSAPVQAAWLGYFATTGVAEIDYIIGDPNVTPPGESDHFTEAVWPLPEIYYCFTPPAVAVEVSALPALSKDCVTFGCFNNLTKVSEAVIAVWARVLHAVPGSRLMLKAKQLGDETVRQETFARFAAQGITEDRLLTEPQSSRADYLHAYHRIDIALDPFPYPGGATSAEALWMGVPVLTRRGDRFLSHAGETIMRNAGLPDWIAGDDDDYVAKAAYFAADLDRLAALRARLRQQVLASPLFDAPRFARHFEDAVWGMWNRRTSQQDPRAAAMPVSTRLKPEVARTFLHVGCGSARKHQTTPAFAGSDWRELRLDIDPAVGPDIIGTMTNMEAVADESIDAIFSSHNIEHLYPHEVPMALAEFLRVLKPDGFAVITCPDLQSVARLIAEDKLTEPAYFSPAGPISPLDMVYGLRSQMAAGNLYMAHRCGFTEKVLRDTLTNCGFKMAVSCRRLIIAPVCNLWAIASKNAIPEADLLSLAAAHVPQ